VPLGRRSATGILIEEDPNPNEQFKDKIKSIKEPFQDGILLSDKYLSWAKWIADYYFYPVGMVVSGFFPPVKKSLKKIKSSEKVLAAIDKTERARPELTKEQSNVLNDFEKLEQFAVQLLFGVTGSGKTEVYLQMIEKTLAKGKQALVLVPEISLTPQLVQRFYSRFGDQIAVIHSQLSPREKTDFWWEVAEGRKKILIGARSALFCAMNDLGLIIVDEEHEQSYKQDEKLKYNARDCAVMLARNFNIPIVLGSATPSLESWNNVINKKYLLSEMPSRVNHIPAPEVSIIDFKIKANMDPTLPKWLSVPMYEAIKNTLENKLQVALFLNRRGSAQFVLCQGCGYIEECPNCDISLSLHHRTELLCHYCGYSKRFNLECGSCKDGELSPIGAGTELVETDLKSLFPDFKIARADRDEIQNRQDLEQLISEMESGETHILVGTQMIAKGLDFPKLNLVGIILADVGFHLPDFRATERSFQLIQQMAGRAGRDLSQGSSGKVIIQTYNPDHPALKYALANDFKGFAAEEIQNRTILSYPPLGKLVGIRIQSTQLNRVIETSRLMSVRFKTLQSKYIEQFGDVEFLGPVEAPISKLRGMFRYQALVKTNSSSKIHQVLKMLISDEEWVMAGVRIIVDVDPIYLL
jgi:primosomal protein N' (replication factor Y)